MKETVFKYVCLGIIILFLRAKWRAGQKQDPSICCGLLRALQLPPSSDSAVSIQTPLFFSRWTWGGPVFVFLQGPSEGRPWLRRVLPIYCHLRLRSVTLISSCFVSLKRSALEICLGQKMRAIFLRQVVWKVCNLLRSLKSSSSTLSHGITERVRRTDRS